MQICHQVARTCEQLFLEIVQDYKMRIEFHLEKLESKIKRYKINVCEDESEQTYFLLRAYMVMQGGSFSEHHWFESQHRTLDRHFFTSICCGSCNVEKDRK